MISNNRNLDERDEKNYSFDKEFTTVSTKYATIQGSTQGSIQYDNEHKTSEYSNKDLYLLNIMDTPGSTSLCGEAMSCIILCDGASL